MTVRTSTRTVTFTRPFILKGYEESLPPGRYEVETDEELFEGISFPAYRRIMTLIHLRPSTANPAIRQTLKIEPADLDAALKRDRIAEPRAFNSEIIPVDWGEPRQYFRTETDKRAIERGENEGMSVPAEQLGDPLSTGYGNRARTSQ